MFVIILGVLFLLIGCDRTSKPIGNRSAALANSPSYAVGVNPATLSAPVNVASVAPNFGPKALDGAAIYAANCSACHQITGQGIPGAFPPLDGSAYVTGDNVERMASIMLYGLMGPITVNGVQYNSVMAPLGAALNDEELAAVASYIRSGWSNKAGPVDAAVFAAARSKWGLRGPFQISELGEEPS